MSFIDKIKKIFKTKEETAEKEVQEETETPVEDIIKKLSDKEKKSSEKLSELKIQVYDKISLFDETLNESAQTIENIDLSGKKEAEKIKIINKENLITYASYLRRLTEKLKNIDEPEVQDYFQKIFNALNDFNKSSRMSFEKATILVGKEVAEARQKVRDFAKDIEETLKLSKPFFDEQNSIKKLKVLSEELKQNLSSKNEIELVLKNIETEIVFLNKEKEKASQKIEEIKNSREYQKDLQKKEEAENVSVELDRKIYSLKEKIDLKEIARVYHSDKKNLKIIKEYSSNFKNALKNDDEMKLAEIIKEKQNDDAEMLKNLKEEIIKDKNKEITETEKQIIEAEEKIKDIAYKLNNLNENSKYETKKKEKLEIKTSEIMKEVNDISKRLFE